MAKNKSAVALGRLRAEKGPSMKETARLGGLARAAVLSQEERSASASNAGKAGAAARAAAMTPERRKEIAAKAAATRWGKRASTGGTETTGKSG